MSDAQSILNVQYQAALDARREAERPCMLWRPALVIDGNKWCALYGDNPQDGVAGFGDTPATAMADFDRAWTAPISTDTKGTTK